MSSCAVEEKAEEVGEKMPVVGFVRMYVNVNTVLSADRTGSLKDVGCGAA